MSLNDYRIVTFDFNRKTGKAQIITDDVDLLSTIREHFSVENKAAAFLRRGRGYKSKFISTRKYAITPTGQFEAGMYWEILKFLRERQYIFDLKHTDSFKELQHTKTTNYTPSTTLSLDLRDYQLDVIKAAFITGRGVCVLGTGAGKTLITANLIQSFFEHSTNKNTFKCILIVPDLGLVTQTYQEFVNYGTSFKVTKWTGSNKPDLTSNVIICNIGILQSQFESNDWVEYVDLLVVDECHKIRANNSISKIITKIKTKYRYGFTGTLPEDNIDKWSVIGKFGSVVYEKNSFSLRNEDFLVNVSVKVVNITYNQRPPNLTNNNYRDELTFIYSNSYRNEVIQSICSKFSTNTLVLVNHIAHGEELYSKLLNITDKRVYFIRGEVAVEERDKVKAIMEQENNVICVAISAIFSTGINIKNLHNIIFAAGGKSFVRTVQSIGRGLRKHENKSKLVIIDICDNLKYGLQHSLKRQEIYTKEKIKFNIKTLKQA